MSAIICTFQPTIEHARMDQPVLEQGRLAVILHTRPAFEMSDDEFFEFCRINREFRIEQTSGGDLIVMTPTGGETGHAIFEISGQVREWAKRDGMGAGFDSSTGFVLPNGAKRSPDVAWVTRARLAPLSRAQKRRFLPLCPDLVVELRSPGDNPGTLLEKMREYTANGARIGLLVDPLERRVHVCRPGREPEALEAPAVIEGIAELPGLRLELAEVWEPRF